MKRSILLICFSFLFAAIYSQDHVTSEIIKTKNAIGIYSNIGICELSGHQDQTGIVSAHGKVVLSYGINYIRTISQKLKLETGIFYTKYNIVDHLILEPYFDTYLTEYLKIISIPILIKYYFPQNYYLIGGTSLDLVSSRGGGYVITDSQNGFGVIIGAGKEMLIKRFSLNIEPNFILHASIPFSGDLSQQKFFVPGLKIGLNYNID